MQFLKTLFWALLVGVVVAFSLNNMTMVPVRLWGSVVADVNLPLLLIVTFLLGFVPAYLSLVTVRWRARQRIAATERALADLRAAQATPPATLAPGDLPAARVVPAPAVTPVHAVDAPVTDNALGEHPITPGAPGTIIQDRS
ncbi:LapA family protein [Sphingomonas sp. ACRSK]|uniref:LapA family protein n=1 Tax=Sphingomonas sp. ACRSK TaxID=2918213 RepID=UPI001EF40A3B|nr:LapA family protein [Sphingomonas sp. ACRSK]MCG7346913.1 LapA family protein [Sphingomonas sp. ACRSK]